MLQLLLPPLVIIVAIAALIIFVAKRSQKAGQSSALRSAAPSGRSFGRSNVAYGNRAAGPRLVEKLRAFGTRIHGMLRSLFTKERRRSAATQTRQPQRPLGETTPQELLEQSTLSFIRRRVLLQEQRRNPVQGRDVESPEEFADAERFDQEENALISYIADNPTDIDAYERLGNYYVQHQQIEDARQCFKQILKIQPRNRLAQSMLSRLDTSQQAAQKRPHRMV